MPRQLAADNFRPVLPTRPNRLTTAVPAFGDKHEAPVILEVAILDVLPGKAAEFEQAFAKARTIIAGMPGHVSHQLQRCLENANRYILLVRWQRLEDHTHGFRQSPEYQEWKRLLHHFYDPFPTVEHYVDTAMALQVQGPGQR